MKRNERIKIDTKVINEEKTESWACFSVNDWEVEDGDEFFRAAEEEIKDSQAPTSMNPPPATV